MEHNPIKHPITTANFKKYWKIVDKERRKAKKKKFISGITAFFGHMLLNFLLVLVGNGLIYNHTSGIYHEMLENIPHFLRLWNKCSGPFLTSDQKWYSQLLICFAGVYIACFVFCYILNLLLTVLYHPFKNEFPDRSDKENARLIIIQAHRARNYSNDTNRKGAAVFWGLIGFTSCFLLLRQYAADAGITWDMFLKLIHPRPFEDPQFANIYLFLFVLCWVILVIIVYSRLSALHTFTVEFLYRYHLSYDFVADVERYYAFLGEDTTDLYDDEIKHLRATAAEDLMKQALELEVAGKYKKARDLMLQAAHRGNLKAMEHYARFNLVEDRYDIARYWLEKCVATDRASRKTRALLSRVKRGKNTNAKYRKK